MDNFGRGLARKKLRRLLGATPPPAPTGRKRPSARASRSLPASPRGFATLHPSRYALTRISRPPKGAGWCPRSRHHRPGQEPPASIRHRHKVFKKGQATARGLDKPPWFATLSHPPRPFPLGRGASRPLSSGVQAARRFACFSCPPSLRLGPFQVRQGPGFALSIPARVLAFGCGPRQPGFRPLTHFPLKNREPRRIEGRHTG